MTIGLNKTFDTYRICFGRKPSGIDHLRCIRHWTWFRTIAYCMRSWWRSGRVLLWWRFVAEYAESHFEKTVLSVNVGLQFVEWNVWRKRQYLLRNYCTGKKNRDIFFFSFDMFYFFRDEGLLGKRHKVEDVKTNNNGEICLQVYSLADRKQRLCILKGSWYD